MFVNANCLFRVITWTTLKCNEDANVNNYSINATSLHFITFIYFYAVSSGRSFGTPLFIQSRLTDEEHEVLDFSKCDMHLFISWR